MSAPRTSMSATATGGMAYEELDARLDELIAKDDRLLSDLGDVMQLLGRWVHETHLVAPVEPAVALVIVEDRHVEVTAYAQLTEAVTEATRIEGDAMAQQPEGLVFARGELNEQMIRDGCVFYRRCSPEGDTVRVVMRVVK